MKPSTRLVIVAVINIGCGAAVRHWWPETAFTPLVIALVCGYVCYAVVWQ